MFLWGGNGFERHFERGTSESESVVVGGEWGKEQRKCNTLLLTPKIRSVLFARNLSHSNHCDVLSVLVYFFGRENEQE